MSQIKFTKYEEWEDYWCFKPIQEVSLVEFDTLNRDSWKPPKNAIKVIIESKKENAEPLRNQINTLSFVKDKQFQILNSIYNFHQAIIFPLYKANIDIEEDQIISEISQTNIIYSIEFIQIPLLEETESIYFILNFNFAYDDEHDISFLFKNLSIIDFVGLGDDFIDYIELHEEKLKKGNKALKLNIYDHPAKASIFRGEYSLNDKINFTFENKPYTIGIYRENWPQSFRVFFYPNNPINEISLNDIIDTTHNKSLKRQ